MNFVRILIVIIFLQFSEIATAQQILISLNREAVFSLENKIYQSDSNLHSCVKPYTYSELKKAGISNEISTGKFFMNEYYQNYFNSKSGFFISPMVSGSGQLQVQNRSIGLPEFSAGVYLEGHLGNKFAFCGKIRYLGEDLPDYLDSNVYGQGVIPTVSRVNNSQSDILFASQLEGYLSYQPNEYFSFLVGKGRNFFGDGYRSLLLSDNASSYPYLRINSQFWNVKYVNLYSWHNDFSTGMNRSKFSASHLLSWNIVNGVNLGIFETVIWQGKDTLNNRGYDIGYLNPVIFYRPVEYSKGSSDNSILGANLKVRIKKQHTIYGQIVLDEFLLDEIKSGNKWWANKQGGQIGYKYYNAFGVQNLVLQSEFNIVRPFTYSHLTSLQNYGHNNQSLAHPVGANFWESVSFVRYSKNKWYFEEEFSLLNVGKDTSSISYGGDMFKSYVARDGDYGHLTGQGQNHKIIFNKIRASYLLFQTINLRAFAQYMVRADHFDHAVSTSHFFQLGISSALWNEYRDY